ncbi:SRPBCC family protein [Spongiivirga sp. MCCC 1A20706]|uniref:SRPBCC family protein n=1 Tax=Spongiivirga sp. MCCC 1A20706 TaxID=3160963 RepID=UPI003977AFCA
MKYTIETIIQKPLHEVTQLYNNINNNSKWMPGLITHETISSHNREPGSKSIYTFNMKGRDFTITETILQNNLTEIIAEFTSNGTVNTQTTQFSKINDTSTSYKVHESFKLTGFMKVIGFLMPGSFKKQTRQFVDAFKEFAES